VLLTSNDTRELSEALKRRCLYLHLDYPSIERERAIELAKVPGIEHQLADEVVRVVRTLRQMELEKHPSVSETLDWARTLVLLGVEHVDTSTTLATLELLLKYQADIELATRELAGTVR
jgi:MoxR-like ATPase